MRSVSWKKDCLGAQQRALRRGAKRFVYLTQQALAFNPSPFMTGLSKLLPLMVEGNPDAPIIVERVRYTDDK
jgi:hypothetical protein